MAVFEMIHYLRADWATNLALRNVAIGTETFKSIRTIDTTFRTRITRMVTVKTLVLGRTTLIVPGRCFL